MEKAKVGYEGDKQVKSAVESVQSRFLWWTARGEHGIERHPLTVEKLQLFGALLAAGCRSAVSYMSMARSSTSSWAIHGRLPWTGDARWEEGLRVGQLTCRSW